MQLRAVNGRWPAWIFFLLLAISVRSEVLISEFMALNNATLADQDAQFSDWIELYNPGPETINLRDWHLTDDPADLAKWSFPSTNLSSDSYLVVFASGKDRRIAGAQL